MNKLILLGNLTNDVEMRYAQGNNTAVGRFSIAVRRAFAKDGEPDTDFFNCVCFGAKAENIEKYFHKGDKICIVGKVQNNNYTNKDGQKVYSTQVIVDEFDFCGTNANKGNATQSKPADDGFMSIPDGFDDDNPLPFM